MKIWRFIVFFFLLDLVLLSGACNWKNSAEIDANKDETTTTQRPRKLVGGLSPISKEDMEDEGFQRALAKALGQLDEVNKCHTFQLIKVIRASKQIVSGVLYKMNLEVKPTFSPDSEEECSNITLTFVGENRVVELSVLAQVWRDPTHVVTFLPNSDFKSDGLMVMRGNFDEWIEMTPEEFKLPIFQKAIKEAIKELDSQIQFPECLHYEFIEMVDGKKKLASRLDFIWNMKVNKVYEYKKGECMTLCADDCSGISIYRAEAYVSPPTGDNPRVTEVKFEKRLSPSFVDEYGPE